MSCITKSTLTVLINFLLVFNVLSNEIIIYENQDFQDGTDYYSEEAARSLKVDISGCSNFPLYFANRVLSVNTQNHCVRLYDEENCSGDFIEMLPRSPAHADLYQWNFGGRAESAGPCRDECSPEIIGNATTQVQITIFSMPDFKGSSHDITLNNGCTPLPNDIVNDVSSMRTNGHCIQLYNSENCELTGNKVDTIELRPELLSFHREIQKSWHFPITKSISRCSYKCNNSNSSSNSNKTFARKKLTDDENGEDDFYTVITQWVSLWLFGF